MQVLNAAPAGENKPGAKDDELANGTPEDSLENRPERLLSWLDMAERYHREAVNRNS